MIRPIIIAAVPRSGSSLIAGIFAAHGVWVGGFSKKVMSNTPIPYDSYENDDVNKWFLSDGEIDLFDIVPKDSRWFYKCSPEKAIRILKVLDNPVCVKIERKPKSIILSSADVKHIHVIRMKQMAMLEEMDGMWISSDDIMAGNFSGIKSVFTDIGLVFDQSKANKVIDRGLWHHE